MSKEVSAGIIIYRRTREGLKYLLLYQKNRYWNFPKGKLEEKERSFRAAIREVKEETGINYKDLRFRDYFKAYDRFVFMREGKKVSKLVMFYLAESSTSRVRIEDEHDGYVWLSYPDAIGLMKYKNLKDILKKANDVVCKKNIGGGQKGSPRAGHHVRRSRPRRRPSPGSASRRQRPPQKS